MRITPKQKRELVSICQGWGECFWLPWNYQFLIDRKLVEPASTTQVGDYYRGLVADLQRTKAAILAAVERANWKEVKTQAIHAEFVASNLRDQAAEADRLFVLTRLGKATAETLIEKQAVESGAH